jgi:PAS domain S-box-containing protein
MFSFKKLSITNKLKLIVMVTCLAAILAGSFARMAFTYINHRADLVRDLTGLAAMISQNTSVALAFNIPEDAEKALSVLSNRKSIVYACLYDFSGKSFAAYPVNSSKNAPFSASLAMGGHLYDSQFLHLVHPILVKGERVGTLYLRDDMSSISELIWRDIIIDLLVILMALGVAYLVASNLQYLITRPVLSLAKTAESVSRYKDYSVRASKEHSDEVGSLIDAFNEMLSQIQQNAEILRESEGRFRTLIEKAPVAIAIIRDTKYVYANPAYAVMFGFRGMNELIGQSVFDRIAPQGLAEFAERVRERDQGLPAEESYEVVALRRDGTEFSILAAVTQVNLADGPATLGFFQDITERKRAEEERIQIEAHLRQAQKMEAIGTLSGGIAHDFNNILSVIVGFTELELESSRRLEEGDRENLRQVLVATSRAKDLVKRILTFSRNGNPEVKTVQIDLLVKEALQFLRASIPSTVEIHSDLVTDQLFILAEPTQIHQVILNLCTNAAYAMREKGGKLLIGLAPEKIDPESTLQWEGVQPGNYVKLTISDTGEGMSLQTLERIFEPFFTTKPVGQGTGLGLSVVNGIVKSHHGGIKISSAIGSGTTIEVIFPMHDRALVAESTLASSLVQGHGEHILIVDDEPDITKMLQASLRLLGYQTSAENSSRAALKLFRESPGSFQLVLTDQTMPDLTGLDLAREIRRLCPDCPIILCTGHSDGITESLVRELGVTDFLHKPVDFNTLSSHLAKALDRGSKKLDGHE